MSEVKRYTATELRFSTTASGDYVAGAVFDELRQQLADVSNELDTVKRDRFAALIQVKEGEARNAELERVLGGMLFAFDDGVGQDWSAPLLDYARKQCKAVEYVDYPNAEIAADAAAGLHDIDFPGPDEEQSDAPATDEQVAGA